MQKPSALPANQAVRTVYSIQFRDLANGGLSLALAEDCGVGTPCAGRVGRLAERLAAAVTPALCPQEHRGLLSIRYPMEHGIVKDWNDMERIWQYVYSKDQLQTFSEEVRVL